MIQVFVNTKKIEKNIKIISKLCKVSKCILIFSIKALAGNEIILEKIFKLKNIPDIVADAREIHFMDKKLFMDKTKILIRVPSYNLKSIDGGIENVDIFYISDLKHIILLEKLAAKHNKILFVILVFDTGDGREGILLSDTDHFLEVCKFLSKSKWLVLRGISTNTGCLSEMKPSKKTLNIFIKRAKILKNDYGFCLEYIVGGSSNILPLMKKQGKFLCGINTVCVGEAILLGTIPGFRKNNIGLQTNIFSIGVEICEIKQSGSDKYRCLLSMGKNDINQKDILWPNGIDFVNYSSDYTVITVTQTAFEKYIFRNELLFLTLKYYALPRLLNSPYAKLCFIN